MTTLLKNENKPKVAIFKGRAIRFRIGLIIKKIRDRTEPPKIKVRNPPDILTPSSIWDKTNREAV